MALLRMLCRAQHRARLIEAAPPQFLGPTGSDVSHRFTDACRVAPSQFDGVSTSDALITMCVAMAVFAGPAVGMDLIRSHNMWGCVSLNQEHGAPQTTL